MRCCAPAVREDMIAHRSTRSTERRCQRNAHQLLITRFGDRWFCYQHFPIWQRHYEIVERILAMPIR